METHNASSYPAYRWIMAALLLLVAGVKVYCSVMVSPIMGFMMEDLHTDLATIGSAATIVTAVGGVFQLIGVVFIQKLGVKKSFIASCICMTVGNGLCMLASEAGLFLCGRAVVGVGFGLASAGLTGLVYMWFPAKERPAVFTANALVCSGVMFIGYNVTIPILEAFNSWKGVFGTSAVFCGVILLAWCMLGKERTSAAAGTQSNGANPFQGLVLAFHSPALWKFSVLMTSMMVMYYGITFYFPIFLSDVRGMSAAQASSITSVVQIASAAGNLTGGGLTMELGRRKSIILPSVILSLFTLSALLLGTGVGFLIAAMFLFGFGYSFMGPAIQTASTEVEGMTPAMASGANFMLFGFGSILSIAISPVLSNLGNLFGLQTAMSVFCISLVVIAIGAAFLIPETGPNANNKKEQ